ncbi:hypothetical protein EJ05DRAFT_500397 [Pseudovirgaria hyperparasitica]|uniref:BZIP domain-containing protein n=1 Tax=Pseudovirgaria hyperparasitica TaxID=470096 RepID=A0A6A6W7D7_9PEZI|nr:uncharacterized protein EJ05DRAFT_500397 [Pseudovirgaria hyperparasitica]KAF2757870.1 hypothetical protein EJ05DRAFT_500397 [Pseudovirgaria hyperparasitica]
MPSAVGKKDPEREPSSGSVSSTPEPDPETYTQEEPQQQKRKGGRKPIYATSEERKQRNRQAQAAFRERRTEYIKQLESTIKHHEETLQNLQQNHRTAADECLMLRYKNSLLERILLEKGIDVQAELQAKTGSPNLGPVQAPPANTSPAQPPMRSAIMNNHRQRRSLVGMPHKLEGVPAMALGQHEVAMTNRSPLSQPTSASHLSSPATTATKSPNFMPVSSAIHSPNFGPLGPQQHMRQTQQPPRSQFNQIQPPPQRPSVITAQQSPSGMTSGGNNVMSGNTSAATGHYYPSPFQSHMDQLGKLSRPQQEYDAQADMLDEQDPAEHAAGPGPFPNHYTTPQLAPQQSPHGLPNPPVPNSNTQTFQSPVAMHPTDTNGNFQNINNQMFDSYDPMLDADPFGLSASMHFPTQFQYESR